MSKDDIGYYEEPANSNGIIRARTTKQIRSWEMSRSLKSLERLNKEFGSLEYPGIYILLEGNKKVYIGESKNLHNRLKSHINNPEAKIKNWDKVIVINDGRTATQSDFNDGVVRKALELYLVKLFYVNKYTVVSLGEPQKLNARQKYLVGTMTQEFYYILKKKNIVMKTLEQKGQEEVFSDELKIIIQKSGKKIEKWSKYEALINGEKIFIRAGSKKPKGWQITFRGRKPGSFIDSLHKAKGYLLVARNGVPLVPLNIVQKVIKDRSAFKQDTIDIWIVFSEDRATLSYKNNKIDITEFRIFA